MVAVVTYDDAQGVADAFRRDTPVMVDLGGCEIEVARSRRYARPLALLMIDVDGLRAVNDTRGHPAGDKLLAALAAILREGVREVDLPARYGGDEFAVLLPETTLDGAAIAAERLRVAVAGA